MPPTITSATIRRQIGILRKRLTAALDTFSQFPTDPNDISKFSDDDLTAMLDDVDGIYDALCHDNRKLKKYHNGWNDLISKDPAEGETKKFYVDRLGEYEPLITASLNAILAMPAIQQTLIEEGRRRKLTFDDSPLPEHLVKDQPKPHLRTAPDPNPIPIDNTLRPAEETIFQSTEPQVQAEGARAILSATDGRTKPITTITSQHKSPLDSLLLPKIELPTFDGNLMVYHEFWEQFVSLVDSTNLDDVLKFHYLRSTLQGRAKSLLNGLSSTAANYPIAKRILHDEYGNPLAVKHALQAKLFNLPDQRHASPAQLHDFWRDASSICRQLEAIGEPHNDGAVLERKLPRSMLSKLYAGATRSLSTMEILDRLYETVKHDALIERLYEDNEPQAPAIHTSMVASSNDHRRYSHTRQRSRPGCYLCSGPHHSRYCSVYQTTTERKVRARQLNLCDECFGPGHQSIECRKRDAYEGQQDTYPQNQGYWIQPAQRRDFSEQRAQLLEDTHRPWRENTHQSTIHQRTIPPRVQQANGQPRQLQQGPPRNTIALAQMDEQQPEAGTTLSIRAQMYTSLDQPDHEELSELEEVEDEGRPPTPSLSDEPIPSWSRATKSLNANKGPILMKAKTITISNPEDRSKSVTVLALFDSGSNKSFITSSAAQVLGLRSLGTTKCRVDVFASGNTVELPDGHAYVINVTVNDQKKPISVTSVPLISNPVSTAEISSYDDILEDNLWSLQASSRAPDVLIGLDAMPVILGDYCVTTLPSGHQIYHTDLGPILSGGSNRTPSTTLIASIQAEPTQSAPIQGTPHQSAPKKLITNGMIPSEKQEIIDKLERHQNLEAIRITESTAENTDDVSFDNFTNKVRRASNTGRSFQLPIDKNIVAGANDLEEAKKFLAQVVLQAILILQQPLHIQLAYDDDLPSDMHDEWKCPIDTGQEGPTSFTLPRRFFKPITINKEIQNARSEENPADPEPTDTLYIPPLKSTDNDQEEEGNKPTDDDNQQLKKHHDFKELQNVKDDHFDKSNLNAEHALAAISIDKDGTDATRFSSIAQLPETIYSNVPEPERDPQLPPPQPDKPTIRENRRFSAMIAITLCFALGVSATPAAHQPMETCTNGGVQCIPLRNAESTACKGTLYQNENTDGQRTIRSTTISTLQPIEAAAWSSFASPPGGPHRG